MPPVQPVADQELPALDDADRSPRGERTRRIALVDVEYRDVLLSSGARVVAASALTRPGVRR